MRLGDMNDIAMKAARYWMEGQDGPDPPTTTSAAALFGIHPSSVERARAVLRQGTPELIDATENGALPLNTAKRLSRRTPAEQRRVVGEIARGRSARAAFPGSRRVPVRPLSGHHRAAQEYVTIMGIEQLEFMLTGLDRTLSTAPGGLEPAITSSVARDHIKRIERGRSSIKRLLTLLYERSTEDAESPA